MLHLTLRRRLRPAVGWVVPRQADPTGRVTSIIMFRTVRHMPNDASCSNLVTLCHQYQRLYTGRRHIQTAGARSAGAVVPDSPWRRPADLRRSAATFDVLVRGRRSKTKRTPGYAGERIQPMGQAMGQTMGMS